MLFRSTYLGIFSLLIENLVLSMSIHNDVKFSPTVFCKKARNLLKPLTSETAYLIWYQLSTRK